MLTRVELSTVVFLIVLSVVISGTLKDVETIPEEQKTAGAELLGPSLSLGVGNGERHRRNNGDKKMVAVEEEDIDQKAAGSELLGPSIDLGYSELGQLQYGQQQKGGEFFGRQDAGGARGEIGFYGSAGRKGSKGHVSEGTYLGNHRASHGDQADLGFYGNLAGARQGYGVGRGYAGAQAYDRKGQAAAGFGSKGGHNKGHHSSGFHNTYHKDESGNNTRFYDDAVDNGAHFIYDARDGAFSDRGADAFKGSFQDEAFRANARGNQGQYGVANGYDDAHGQKGNYARDEFYDDKLNYGQQKNGESFGKNVHSGQQEDVGSFYGKSGEGYGEVVKGHEGYDGPKSVSYGGYVSPPGVYNYNTKGINDYNNHYYYPVGSHSAPSSDYYGKSVYGSDLNGPVYDDIKGKGFATYEDTGPIGNKYVAVHPNDESNGYYGIYRGVVY